MKIAKNKQTSCACLSKMETSSKENSESRRNIK